MSKEAEGRRAASRRRAKVGPRTDLELSVQVQVGVDRLGEWVLDRVDRFGQFALLAGHTVQAALRPRFPWLETLRQLEAIGARSSTIVLITALFTGMVLALQTGIALARFGAKPYVGAVVGLSLARELGPVLTALMVGGRVGAGITAEIGSMQVTEQVDAIRAMGADPVQKLVLPRVLAATAALPLLTILADVLGVLGGLALAWSQFGIDPSFYLQTIANTVTLDDLFSGIVKTFVFGWLIAMVGCSMALQTTGGTVGVGRATTRAVVAASIGVLVTDFFMTQLMVIL
jgi:phospholipid/cholesterol/gamma-HCH transport system permease protein